ncbi:MAG: carbon starvation protein A [Muribaculaceae bacterium]|nr:carbon starvation protein A [Muribaculaceae bacterium]
MLSFIISFVALIAGYFVYGRFIDRLFGPDDRPTPAQTEADGVDYVPLPTWRVFMIQFLNIAGTGPIFGAIMGIWFGPAAYLWIVLGCIFAGAVHDYLSGMLSMRHKGEGAPMLIGRYLGRPAQRVLEVFVILLLMMVGAVFVYSPALILGSMSGTTLIWIDAIFFYYVIATLLPIDKIIGKVYPLFAFGLLFMAVALLAVLLFKWPAIPEIWHMGHGMDVWRNSLTIGQHDALGIVPFLQKNPMVPCMFITIACGAISGFHATQSPLMARCMTSERKGRQVFYGAMIAEGMVALIWAAVASYFFYSEGWRHLLPQQEVENFMAQVALPEGKTLIQYFSAPQVVKIVCSGWLGILGGILAILGVVAAPITSGDTAFRSARLIIAERLKMEQHSMSRRLAISIPLFGVAVLLLIWQINNPDGFNVLWQYFGWSNQTMSVFTLWAITVYLARSKRNYFVTLIPATFMTAVSVVFLLVSPLALGLNNDMAPWLALAVVTVALMWFGTWMRRNKAKGTITHDN